MPLDEDVDEEWVDDDDDSDDDLLVCPVCRAAVHEDTQQCPRCGDWITPVYPSGGARHWMWVVAVVLVITAFLMAMLR